MTIESLERAKMFYVYRVVSAKGDVLGRGKEEEAVFD